MKNLCQNLFVMGVLAALSAATLRAENAVVLESFEDNINAASLVTIPGGRPTLSPPGVTLSQYTKTGDGDANVTEGGKSLQVVLSGKDKYSADFQIKLSAVASAKVRAAAASHDPARYILRYDVIFPPAADFVYFNSALNFGDCRDALISAGGKRSMSIALDLITGLPASGPLTLVLSDDFQTKGTFTNVTVYIDNIRLVDTYAAGAKPVTYVLQSFEDTNNPTGGVANFTLWDTATPRTTYASYTATGPNDVRVTDGKHALQVTYSNPSVWHADFYIPFANTKLADVLKLDSPLDDRPTPDQLARYTLRFDVTYPDMVNDWMNSTFHTTDMLLPQIQTRQGKPTNERQTYSVTLDQTSWGTAVPGYPVLVFISQGPMKASSAKVYYDNFRLVDTGDVSAPAGAR